LLPAALVVSCTLALAQPPDGAPIQVSESANGSTINVRSGQLIELTLHSTYWGIDGSSDDSVVAPARPASVAPAAPGKCLPGFGCGEVRASFEAKHPGTARVSASRTLCGEMFACPPEDRSFSVTVIVR
jgi:hypothetical protein